MGSSTEEKEGEKVEYPTFQETWEFSDLVLVTKQRKFHVHKVCVLCNVCIIHGVHSIGVRILYCMH